MVEAGAPANGSNPYMWAMWMRLFSCAKTQEAKARIMHRTRSFFIYRILLTGLGTETKELPRASKQSSRYKRWVILQSSSVSVKMNEFAYTSTSMCKLMRRDALLLRILVVDDVVMVDAN